MASVAAPYQASPFSPDRNRKRSYSTDMSHAGSARSNKRLQTLGARAIPRANPAATTPKSELTGLEGHLSFELMFVDATKATADSESNLSVLIPGINDQKTSLEKRRQLADSVSGVLNLPEYPQCGFDNFTGSICYRSSLLQCLIHTPKFVNWLLDNHRPEQCVSDDSEDCVACGLRNLVKAYHDVRVTESHVNALSKKIHKLFGRLGWKTDSWNDHGDPDDQLGWILDNIRTEVPAAVWEKFDASHNLILRSEIRCEKCNYASRSDGNEERLLSLPIRPRVTGSFLQSYIDRYMDEEIQDYTCEKCKHKSNKHRVQQIVYAPDVLLLQIKRFNHNGNKDNFKVNYGQTLDLSRHAANKTSKTSLLYQLKSVIQHWGGAGAGHYTSTVRIPENLWTEFDDGTCSDVNVGHALDPTKMASGFTPYLLFYERIADS